VIPDGERGAGQRFLPLESNGKEVDIDLINNIMREPFADRFRLIFNDLGAGLAARGEDLEAIIRRADPALRETDRVLAELARQNQQLARLAADSDRIMVPFARERQHVSGFINNANIAAEATAERSQDLEAGFERFPGALRELRRTMAKLDAFSEQATPVFAEFRDGASAIARSTEALGPFAAATKPALTSLGDAAQQAQQPFVNSDPILRKVRDLAQSSAPGAKSLARLLASLRKTGGYKHLMSFFFNTTGGINGFDQYGHFLRAVLKITTCITLVTTPTLGCTANWGTTSTGKTADVSSPAAIKRWAQANKVEAGATVQPLDAQGQPAGGTPAPQQSAPRRASRRPSMGAARALLDTVIGRQQPARQQSQPSNPGVDR
jgi:hypothetical protein